MIVHKLKLKSQFCNDILLGRKTFEVRKNDRNFHVDDLIVFTPVNDNNSSKKEIHPISQSTFIITYVLKGWGLQEGYVVLAIKEIMKNGKVEVTRK